MYSNTEAMSLGKQARRLPSTSVAPILKYPPNTNTNTNIDFLSCPNTNPNTNTNTNTDKLIR